ncbi:YbaB/EbfC family nucleoid-associated protein [Nocardia sp. CA-107356]|uniref:YbaB/EbfC family nucleoid-associated protein n=1 Tax=Nocardia sp. CA-107356 TaxID=3239972 RepID=UPI003D930C38
MQEQMRIITRLQTERAELTASATLRGKRVTVTVNADNTIIDVKFGSDIDDLSYIEIAAAVREAAQQASAEVARKSRELFEPLKTHRSRMGKLTDVVEGLPDLRPSEPPMASTAPPNAPERQRSSDGSAQRRFADTEAYEHAFERLGEVTQSSW